MGQEVDKSDWYKGADVPSDTLLLSNARRLRNCEGRTTLLEIVGKVGITDNVWKVFYLYQAGDDIVSAFRMELTRLDTDFWFLTCGAISTPYSSWTILKIY